MVDEEVYDEIENKFQKFVENNNYDEFEFRKESRAEEYYNLPWVRLETTKRPEINFDKDGNIIDIDLIMSEKRFTDLSKDECKELYYKLKEYFDIRSRELVLEMNDNLNKEMIINL